MFGPLGLIHVILDLGLAVATAAVLMRISGTPPSAGRYVSIDGLRGYLAFFVFMHHSSIWYFVLHGAPWKVPPSNLYTNLGQASVALFFMITGFLFYGKILNGRNREIDWSRLFLSRILRLWPLYLSVILALFVLVGIRSGWEVHESPESLVTGMIKWAGFTIAGGPDLNGVSHTSLMVAGVTWTLCYEWFFYISLPIIALASFIRTPVWVIAVCLLALMIQLHFWPPRGSILSIFLGGILAALLSGIETFRRFSKSKLASFVVAFSLLVEASGFSTSYAIAPLALLVLSFCLIANGADLFGILSHPLSRVLGEISYGIYLIQGLVLFIYWKYLITIDIASHVGSFTYWLLQSICVPVLLVVSYFAFRYIERPAINSVPVLHKYLVKRLKPKSNLAEEGG